MRVLLRHQLDIYEKSMEFMKEVIIQHQYVGLHLNCQPCHNDRHAISNGFDNNHDSVDYHVYFG